MKKNIMIISFAAIFAMTFFSCKGKSKNEGRASIITFVAGEVKVSGINPERAAKTGESLFEKEILKTGKDSYAVIQIGDGAVVRVQQNSEFNIEKILGDERVVGIKQGELLCKVSKLGKNDSFRVNTPTTAAAVRGTEFSVIYNKSLSIIAVKDGKVAVAPAGDAGFSKARVAESGFTAFEKAVPGKAAVIEIRKITKDEDKLIEKISKTPIIPEVEKKTAEELNKIMRALEEKGDAEKQKAIIQKQSGSLVEIKEAFNRLDEITLYNNRVVTGIIVARGEKYDVVTPAGKMSLNPKEIKNVRVIR